MIIYDKKENTIIETDNFNLSNIIYKQDFIKSLYYNYIVSLCSLKDIQKLYEKEFIDDKLFLKAEHEFNIKQGNKVFEDLKVFVFVDTEKEQKLYCNYTETEANEKAVKEVKNILSDYTDKILRYGEGGLIDVEVYSDKENLIKDYCNNNTIIEFLNLKDK